MRTQRIVARQGIKAELAILRERLKTAGPLMRAEKQLAEAYNAGWMVGYEAGCRGEAAPSTYEGQNGAHRTRGTSGREAGGTEPGTNQAEPEVPMLPMHPLTYIPA